MTTPSPAARPGRPEKRLIGDGPLDRFATELRKLRQAKQFTVRQVAEAMHYSPSVASRMCSGREPLPAWDLVLAFVRACDGDVAAWRRLWAETADELAKAAPGTPQRADARPESAGSHVEFLAELRLRVSVMPQASYRWLARKTKYPHSTIAAAMAESAARLPKWGLVAGVLNAVGEDEARLAVWREVWQRLSETGGGPEADGGAQRLAQGQDPQAVSAEPYRSLAPPLGLLDPRRGVRGRDRLIQTMVDLSDRDRSTPTTTVHVLHGTGGAGKTMVALEVAKAVAAQGTRVWWVSAGQQASLVAGMTTVAREVGCSDEELLRSDPADALWRRLTGHPERWLLVLDGADDPELLDTRHGGLIDKGTGWIRPVAANGLILVTSRFRRWPSWCRRHEVSELNVEDAAQVLRDYCGCEAGDDEDAEKLAAALGRLPLMLKLAGSFLERTARAPFPDPSAPTTFGDFLARFQAMRVSEVEPGEMVEEILRVWNLSLELLTRRGMPDAEELLRLLVTFADEPIPFRVLFTPSSLEHTTLAQPTMTSVSHLLESLSQVSLINLDLGDPSCAARLHIHPLVRMAGRMHPDTIERAPDYLASGVDLIFQAGRDFTPPEHPLNWQVWSMLAPHALHLLETAGISGAPEELMRKAGKIAADSIRSMIARGDFHTAVRHLGVVLEMARKTFGDEDHDTLHIMHEQATALRKIGQYQEAELAGQAAWAMSKRLRGEDHEITLDLRRDLAIVHLEMGRYQEAECALREVAERRRTQLGEDDPETLSTVHALARVLCELGRYHQAGALFDEVYNARRRLLGEEHPDTLTTLRNMARVLDDLGRPAEAEHIYVDLFELSVQVLGEEHPDTLLARFDLAKNCLYQGRYRAAEAEFRMVLDARCRILGETHPRTLTSRRYLAMALHSLALWDKAEREYGIVYTHRRRLLGDEHPHTLSARFSIAILRRDKGSYSEAHLELLTVYAYQTRQLGRDHKDTLETLHELAVTAMALGQYKQAEWVFDEVCGRRMDVLGAQHPDTLRGRRARAGLLMVIDRRKDALYEHLEVLRLSSEVLGEEHPETLKARSELACVYGLMKDNQVAKRELEPVLEAQSRFLGRDHPDTVHTRLIQARILFGEGRLADAERTFDEVLAASVRMYGRSHPYTLKVFHERGLVYLGRGQLPRAEFQFRTIYQARQRLLGIVHPDTFATRHALALVLRELGRVHDAADELAAVLRSRRDLLGPDHRDTIETAVALRMCRSSDAST